MLVLRADYDPYHPSCSMAQWSIVDNMEFLGGDVSVWHLSTTVAISLECVGLCHLASALLQPICSSLYLQATWLPHSPYITGILIVLFL